MTTPLFLFCVFLVMCAVCFVGFCIGATVTRQTYQRRIGNLLRDSADRQKAAYMRGIVEGVRNERIASGTIDERRCKIQPLKFNGSL